MSYFFLERAFVLLCGGLLMEKEESRSPQIENI